MSPFSRGGYVCSETFDHTSLPRFVETRFGVAVPNLSDLRRVVTGDLTSAPALSQQPDTSVPALPTTSLGDTFVAEQAVLNALTGTLDVGVPCPMPDCDGTPAQEDDTGTRRCRPPHAVPPRPLSRCRPHSR